MGNTTTLGNKSKFRELVDSFGLPRLIIACFLLLLLIAAPCVGLDFPTQITNIITRFSWNAVMVLAMVPMVHSGCGLNFGLPLGIVSGLLGATLSIELGYTGFASFLMAILIATPFALLFGGGYGWLLNQDQGRRNDDRHLRGLLVRVLHVHDVAAAAVQAPYHGVGLLRQRSAYRHFVGGLL